MISVLFWSVWRRLYGCGEFKKIISRTVQTLIAIAVLTYQLSTGYSWQEILLALGVSVWVVLQYFSRAVGEILDAGLNPCQSRKEYGLWFRPIVNWIVAGLNWIFDKLHTGWHIHKYYGVYDWIYSAIRNLWGLFPAMIFYPSCWWVVVISFYPIYFAFYWIWGNHLDLWTNKTLMKMDLNEPKNWAEIICGGLFGLAVRLV